MWSPEVSLIITHRLKTMTTTNTTMSNTLTLHSQLIVSEGFSTSLNAIGLLTILSLSLVGIANRLVAHKP